MRTYAISLIDALWRIPLVQLALLWRCYSQGPGGLKSGTLLEDELAFEMWGKRP